MANNLYPANLIPNAMAEPKVQDAAAAVTRNRDWRREMDELGAGTHTQSRLHNDRARRRRARNSVGDTAAQRRKARVKWL